MTSLRTSLCWHCSAAALLLFATPQLMLGEPLWSLPLPHSYHLIGIAAAYLGAAAATELLPRRTGLTPLVSALSAGVSFLALVFFALLMLRGVLYSRRVVLAGSFFTIALLVLPLWRSSIRKRGAVGMGAVTIGVIALGYLGGEERRDVARGVADSGVVADSVLYTTHELVEAVYYENFIDPGHATGGAIAALGDRYLLVTGDGKFYSLTWDPGRGAKAFKARKLSLTAPLNSEEFQADVTDAVNTSWFRVADLLTRTEGDAVRLIVSHHHWKRRERCFVLRLSTTRILKATALASMDPPGWSTLYETEPCLPIKDYKRGFPFTGLEAGGRLAIRESGHVLFTVGDHAFDGWNWRRALAQDRSADYGKTLLIGLDGTRQLLSLGHRNPQGLAIDSTGEIWSTEHGPDGGDELNRLVRGGNYGWPHETYGTAYRLDVWPLAETDTGLGDFRSPVFAWVPSIGISNLLWMRGRSFEKWEGDLVVSSLRERSLFRLRFEEGRVAFVEPIRVGYRIRDLVEGPDGRLALWTDSGTVISLRAAPPDESGPALFRRCAGCHSAQPSPAPGRGPNLWNIVNRPIASSEEFSYSDALRSLDGRWRTDRLDAFLADPDSFAPGTTMDVPGVESADRRKVLIDYLKSFQ